MKLYITYRSPYARKVRIALYEKALDFDEIDVDLSAKSNEFCATSPLQTVPTLVTNDDLVLADSTNIIHYLEKTFQDSPLIPSDPTLYWQCWLWHDMANRLCDKYVGVFFEKQEQNPRQKVFDKAQALQDRILEQLNSVLNQHEFILKDFSLADIAMGSTLKWMEFRLGLNIKQYSQNVSEWLDRLDKRLSFSKTLPRL